MATYLKNLLQARHLQTHAAFCREYDRLARELDPALVGKWPSRATLHRWMTGEVKRIPYPDHCRILEGMFRGWTVEQLLQSVDPPSLTPETATQELGRYHRGPSPREEDEDTKRRDFLKFAAVVPVVAPEILSRVLADAATEAMAWTRHAGASMLGPTTFDHLEAVLARLDGAYGKEPAADLFRLARAYRAQVAEMIQGRHTLKEGRELYVYAAWLSRRLAWLAQDLGAPGTAEAYAIDCFGHADEAGHSELCAFAMDAASVIAEFDGRIDDAIAAARRGISKISVGHPLAARLRAQAATAQARLGKRQECEDLLAEATRLHDRLPSSSTGPTAIAATCAVTAYPASAYVRLGDFTRARTSAEEALSALPWQANNRWLTQEALTRLDLGIALTELGFPEGAVTLGRLALSSRRGVGRIVSKAGDLDRALNTRYPDLADARDFHEQYRQTASQSV
jgi:tetratricopeptide (TPR) repeat protein